MEPTNIRLPGWTLGKELGKGGFGSVYQISRDVFGTVEHNALKVINLPQEQGQIEFMRLSGMNDASIIAHLQSQVKSFLEEYSIMQALQDNPHIVHCYDFQHIPQKDKFSWTILIRMELLTPLLKAMDKVATEEQIIQLGLDMCSALMACQEHKIIHRDIKPQNVFVAKNGSFKLGDFGISKILDDASKAHTQAGTLLFMAPEIAVGKPYNATVDIYSLGLMLYWLLNHRRGPFLPLPPKAPSFGEDQQALARRLKGDSFPPPANGSNGLKQVVMKACSFRPEDRYQTAKEMQQALRALRSKHSVHNDTGNGTKQEKTNSVSYVVSSVQDTGMNSYFFFRDMERIATVTQPVLSDEFALDIKGKLFHLSHSMKKNLSSLPAARELRTDSGKVYASVSGHKDGKSTIICLNKHYTVTRSKTGWEIRLDGKSVATITDLKKVPPKWTVQQEFLYANPLMGFSGSYQMECPAPIPDELAMVFLSYPLLEYPAARSTGNSGSDSVNGNRSNASMPSQYSLVATSGTRNSCSYVYLYNHTNFASVQQTGFDKDVTLNIRIIRKNHDGMSYQKDYLTCSREPMNPEAENYRILRKQDGSIFATVSGCKDGKSCLYYGNSKYVLTACINGWLVHIAGRNLASIRVERSRHPDPSGTFFPKAYYLHAQPGFPEKLALLLLTYPLLEFPASPYAEVDTTDISDVTNGSTLNPYDILVDGRVGNLGAVEILLKAKNIRSREDLRSCDQDTLNDLVQAVQQSVSNMPYLAAAELLHYRMRYQEFPLYYDEQMKLRKWEMYPRIAFDRPESFPCRINNGHPVDLRAPMERLPANFMRLEDCDAFMRSLADVTHLKDTGDIMDLACRIIATGEVPAEFRARRQPAADPELDSQEHYLDIYGTLELKYQPRGKDRKQVVFADGRNIQVTLPSKLFTSNPEEIVVKNEGHTDPVTGQTGDAHILVSCKGLFYRPISLLNILMNILLLIVFVVFAVFSVVKSIITSKLFLISAVIGILVYVVLHFFLT